MSSKYLYPTFAIGLGIKVYILNHLSLTDSEGPGHTLLSSVSLENCGTVLTLNPSCLAVPRVLSLSLEERHLVLMCTI
jgi:hypothetical protein